MARFRMVWGLFAFAAMFVVFLVLFLSQRLSEKPQAPVIESIESLVAAEVAVRYAAPSGVPVVTRVSDVATLAVINPNFYTGLQDGDWLVRYPGLLVAYRREEGRIVKVETLK